MSIRLRHLIACVALLIAGVSASSAGDSSPSRPCTLDRATGTTIDAKPFNTGAYAVRWNFPANRLVLMQPGSDGHYHIFTLRPDGTDRKDLTFGPAWANKHQGAPFWHPSGKYILFIAQMPAWTGKTLFKVPNYEAVPGFGRHDDLWLITPDGKKTWQLTNDPNTKDQGILLPVFAPDGKHLAWSARQPGGTYILKVAEFIDSPQPHLGAVQSYTPGGKCYYEPGSFSSDSQSLVYTSDQDTHTFWASQIYRLDLATGKSTRLTHGGQYNEHPVVVKTPTGDWVVYMSDKGVSRRLGHLLVGTDWWAMKLDGTAAKRLTTMNIEGSPENAGFRQVACTMAISPDGTYYLGDVQDSLTKQTGMVRVVHFTGP